MANFEKLPIPETLLKLVESGFWPTSEKDVQMQNIKPLVAPKKVKAIALEEDSMVLMSFPFHSVATLKAGGEKWFWNQPMTAAHEIDHDLTLIIADFGPGSDAPIALDYSRDLNCPRVIYLKWAKEGNHWVELAPNFDSFLVLIIE